MKRLAWLLLALSLPAWATINGVDSSRVVLLSFDGARYGMYVAGDYPETPPGVIWTQDFEALSTSQVFTKNAAVYGSSSLLKDVEGLYWAGNCNSGISISTDQARQGAKSLKFVNNFAVLGDFDCPGTDRSRTEYKMAANAVKLTQCDVSGICNDWGFGTERWLGFSVYFPTAGNANWTTGSSRPIFFQIFGSGATSGDSSSPILYFILSKNGRLDIDTAFSVEAGDLTSDQDYLFNRGQVKKPNWAVINSTEWAALKTSGSSGSEYHLSGAASHNQPYLQRDTWHDFVIHFGKGYTKATGLIEIWMDGTKIVDIPAFPTTVSDFYQSFLKNGLYGNLNASGGTYTMYLDSWRAYDEQGTFNAVDPAQDD